MAELEKLFPSSLRRNVSLGPLTTFHCLARAGGLFSPAHFEELKQAIRFFAAKSLVYGKDWQVLGRGSNVLVRDGGFQGVLVDLGKGFTKIDLIREDSSFAWVRAEAAVQNGALLHWLRERSLGRFGFAYGIPGTIGGGIRMNAGTPQGWFSDVVTEVEGVTTRGEEIRKKVSSKDFLYRDFPEARDWVVTAGTFSFPKSDRASIDKEIDQAKSKRANQPLDLPNIGSVFKNPSNDFAGRLIEAAGLKGFRIGDAEISSKHANFIVNLGKAKTSDALALLAHAQKAVKEKFNVELEPEVHVIGVDP